MLSRKVLSENEKRFQFIEEIMNPQKDFREQVLTSFNQLFGYQKSVFWRITETGINSTNPILFNIGNEEMKEYTERYRLRDPILKYQDSFIKNNVICYSDILPDKEYKQTEYYHFLRKNKNKDIILICLNDGQRLTGIISFLRSIEEEQFTTLDKTRMLFLSKYISKLFATSNRLEESELHFHAIKEYANLLRLGIIIMDDFNHICYYNKQAEDICNDYNSSHKYTIQEFVQHTLDYVPHLTDNFTAELPNLPNIFIKIYRMERSKQFVIFLIPSEQSLEKKSKMLGLLTLREVEISDLLMKGYTNYKIAETLFISTNTVKRHLQNIYTKLGVRNRTELCYQLKSNFENKKFY
ncbi:helix-turn-helix transcriptional regulator [Metabacillus litoralis]|uniref:response regulator transcription factor n=1 Tax=Metabacillus litoralis TaxID=152268 RepID=UPI001B95E73E|nr:helix-turn-helix transcriptional regulator [Metabacillus litoralis]MCM3163651.1 helix-turn-helix transcriptional regulator [Metabacillus litoralis]UHA60733.1 helix-turn-helix transcriptional regulator [Metabacillus litoralis]